MKNKDSFVLNYNHGYYQIDEKVKGGRKIICIAVGRTEDEKKENAAFILTAFNEYANKPVSTEDFNAK